MKYLFLPLLLTTAPVHAEFKFASLADTSQCIGRHISQVTPMSCTSSATRFQSGEFPFGGGSYWTPVMGAGRLKFYATNLCLHANSATSVSAQPCSSSGRQRWHFNYADRNISSDAYGSVLRYNASNDAIIMSNTGFTSNTRRWAFD